MDDILYYIFTFLELRNIIKCSTICKQFYTISKLEQLWSGINKKDTNICLNNSHCKTYKIAYILKKFTNMYSFDKIYNLRNYP